MSKTLEERFWDKVDVSGFDNCWLWLAHKNQNGYGTMSVAGKCRRATHVLFYLRKGHWPVAGRTANHHCDNPGCLNPKHLYLGTQISNVHDRERRGRRGCTRGERNGRAKLTEDQVREIKRLLVQSDFTQADLGRKYNVSSYAIHLISKGVTWSYVIP